MNLGELIAESRVVLCDVEKPTFWSDEWLTSTINEAEQEACIRARLIEDSSSVATSIDIDTANKRYPLHESVLDVLEACLESNTTYPVAGWTLTESNFVLYDYPKADDVVLMTVVRLPLSAMESDTDTPEIRTQHHQKLIDWVKYRAYSVQDADAFDPQGAVRALGAFEQAFGPRQTANVLRKHKGKQQRVVVMTPF
ncbi:hypothetical protein [Propionivibrio sp.]|uniref:phage adaptor protein n=1 Tax=Propionivibrio sp. TaxID=2212460 RepID=UPI003BF2746E